MSAHVGEYIVPASNPQVFVWDDRKSEAALTLARGRPKTEAARAADVDRSTIYEWLKIPEFCAEVDRLSLMVSISSRAERLRVAMRVAYALGMDEETPRTEKDLLDWLKFVQSETDGAKVDLSKLTELLAGESDSDSQPAGPSSQAGVIDVAADGGGDSRLLSDGPAAATSEHGPSPLATEDTLNPS